MCGPADDEKQNAARDAFSKEFESALDETIRKQSSILSSSESSSIFDGDQRDISVPVRQRPRRNGNRGSKNMQWIH